MNDYTDCRRLCYRLYNYAIRYLVVHPTNRLGGLVHPSYFCGRLAPTYPIEITRVVAHLRFVG